MQLTEPTIVDQRLLNNIYPSVETLIIGMKRKNRGDWNLEMLQKFIHCFPNVRKIELVLMMGALNQNITIDGLKHLQKVSIFLNYTSGILSQLILKNYEMEIVVERSMATFEEWKRFVENNPGIRFMTVSSSILYVGAFEELAMLTKLERLTINCSDLNLSLFDDHFKKLCDTCKIITLFKVFDEDACTKFLSFIGETSCKIKITKK